MLETYELNHLDRLPIKVSKIREMIIRQQAKEPGCTISGWVSYEEIQQLMKDNDEANGMRIYIGRHSDVDNDVDLKGRLTIVLVATKNSDFETNPPTHCNSADLLDESIVPPSNGTVNYRWLGDDRIPLCPPKCSKSILTDDVLPADIQCK